MGKQPQELLNCRLHPKHIFDVWLKRLIHTIHMMKSIQRSQQKMFSKGEMLLYGELRTQENISLRIIFFLSSYTNVTAP